MPEKPKIRKPFDGEYPISFEFEADPDWYTSQFGYAHNGTDFAMPKATPIKACFDGQVFFADWKPDADGLGVIIQHEWGLSLYWHLSRVNVSTGMMVSKGQVIGLSGDTGFATGPHLHFGVKVWGYEVEGMNGWTDPMDFIEPEVKEPEPGLKPKVAYRVKKGDSLWKIAEQIYNNGKYWPRIYKANKDKIDDPNLIKPGQKLFIP